MSILKRLEAIEQRLIKLEVLRDMDSGSFKYSRDKSNIINIASDISRIKDEIGIKDTDSENVNSVVYLG